MALGLPRGYSPVLSVLFAVRRREVSVSELYEPVIGLEIHAQLLTKTKAFCGCSTAFGVEPNSHVCPICLGMPGTLPVLNHDLVEFILRMGLATGCRIAATSLFARKNYFYPDLPKGYQISQYEEPICVGGGVDIELGEGTSRRIGITRIHMEEDAGKLIHDVGSGSMVDVNRCGIPLMEIVTEPDLRSPREASLCLAQIRRLVTYLEVCDGNMEEGSLRCDANVSVRKKGEGRYGTKTEIKNMNSFRHVERALEYEIRRQLQLIEEGGVVKQETLLWDAEQGEAVAMRSKEEAHDYRYFPDPDLVPVRVESKWIEHIRRGLPELPSQKRDRFVSFYQLPRYDADILTGERELAEYFEATVKELVALRGESPADHAKATSNWVMTEVLRVIGQTKARVAAFPISPKRLASLIALIRAGTISGTTGKTVFEAMLLSDAEPGRIVEERGLAQLSDPQKIEAIVEEILARNAAQVEKYLKGATKVLGYFVGETMKASGGKANPEVVNTILRQRLEERRNT